MRITALERVEKALRASDDRYQDLIVNFTDGIVIFQDQKVLFANKALARLLGYNSATSIIGHDYIKFVAPEYRGIIEGAISVRGNAKDAPAHYEFRALCSDGTTFEAQLSFYDIVYEGRLARQAVLKDISERRRAEDRISKSEELHRALVEAAGKAGIGILIQQDMPGREAAIVFVNDELCAISQYSRDELLSMSALSLLSPEELEAACDRHRRRQRGERVDSHYELRLQKKDGDYVHVETSVSTMSYGGEVATVVYFLDISARKRVEKELHAYRSKLEKLVNERTNELKGASKQLRKQLSELRRLDESLRKSESYFRSLVENALDAFALLDRDFRIAYESPSIERVLGYLQGELSGRNLLDLVNPDDLTQLRAILTKLIEDPNAVQLFELRALHKNGSWRELEVIARNLLDDGLINGIVVNFRDITERKEAEKRVTDLYQKEKELRLQLEAEMGKRVEFSRVLTHELKSPLTAIIASSDLLASEVSEKSLRGLALNINRSAVNLNNRIGELLDLAKGEIGMLHINPASLNLLPLLREAGECMAPVVYAQNQNLAIDLPQFLPTVHGDASRLLQVISNLITNAIKFTPSGGRIVLRARDKGDRVIVEVQDNGRGISKKDQAYLFKPYHRIENSRADSDGFGLGLALSKMLIDLHHGEVWIRSEPGKGSTFGFSLPTETTKEEGTQQEKTNKLWKILLIEDDCEIVNSIEATFQLQWPEVLLISTRLGEEGVDLVETENPDIVILDICLPDISGLDVLRQIRLFSSVPVIIVTVRSSKTDVLKGLEWGADDYIVKPFDRLELLARIRVQLRRRTASDDNVPLICGPMRFDRSTCQLKLGQKEISLTSIEGDILYCLMNNVGRIVTYNQLEQTVWGEDRTGFMSILRVYIKRLREGIEADPKNPSLLMNKRGIGYYLVKPA